MSLERVVVLIDMDCFYVQVEQREQPELKGKPCAVVQYKTYKGGGTIAVSYEARDHGVKRGMMGEEAQKLCPEIQLVRVPVQRDKADLTKYREAGAEVINVLSQFSKNVERASIDEAYIDLTDVVEARLSQLGDGAILPEMLPFTHVAGWETDTNPEQQRKDEDGDRKRQKTAKSKEDTRKEHLSQWLKDMSSETDKRLAVGALITEEMRAAVLKQTKFNCSAGIAHNKMLAKLVCGLNKPRKQTVLPHNSVQAVFRDLPISKVRGLGGKLGAAVTQDLNVTNMGDLVKYTEQELQAKVGSKTGVWLYRTCRGFEDEPVRPRQLPKSVGCSKNFLGKSCLNTVEKVKFWLGQLSEEVSERLQKEEDLNNRIPKSLSVYVRQQGKPPTTSTRSCSVHSYDAQTLSRTALSLIQNLNRAGSHQAAWVPAIINLGLSASKFTDLPKFRGDNASLDSFFSSQSGGASAGGPSVISVPQKSNGKSPQGLENFFSKKSSPGSDSESLKEIGPTEQRVAVDAGTPPKGDVSGKNIVSFFKKKENAKKEGVDGKEMQRTSHGCETESTEKPKNFKVVINEKRNGSKEDLQEGRRDGDISRKQIDDGRGHDIKEEGESVLRGFFHSKSSRNHSSRKLSPDFKGSELAKDEDSDSSRKEFDEDTASRLYGEAKTEVQASIEESLEDTDVDTKKDSDYVTCDRCQKSISAWDLPEHLDFHVAMDLQRRENGSGTAPSTSGSTVSHNSSVKTVAGKRKGKQQGPAAKKVKSDSNSKTLHSFFSQK
ncbi:DNA polymerase eta [Holothuria leucospilota]|uniref:DNA polymerase eta n=1 Tax=Holothuria leucospilota TaxID=206669 RepID=A0A9Q1HGW3_HOLLE|nr:DNA polymerase eta [Holothuria leucospilota]